MIGPYAVKAETIYPTSADFSTVTADVSQFSTENFGKTEKGYYRMLLPYSGNFMFLFQLTRRLYTSIFAGEKKSSAHCTRIQVGELQMDIYIFRKSLQADLFYLILDSQNPTSFETFRNLTFSALVCLGYICGTFIEDNGYYFQYQDANLQAPVEFRYQEQRASIWSALFPIHSNVHSFISSRQIAEFEKDDIRVLSESEFSILCHQAFSSERFQAALLLIIESAAATQVLMPTGFTGALESLTGIILDENIDKFIPIPQKDLAKQFRDELREVLNRFTDKINSAGIDTLTKKIGTINTPTNSDQLNKPFEIVGFALEEADREAILHRNDFMHGRITLLKVDEHGNEVSEHNETFRHVHYTAMRLYTLLAVLILGRIGYTGKIINYPKVHEQIRDKLVDEPYFRYIRTIPCSKTRL